MEKKPRRRRSRKKTRKDEEVRGPQLKEEKDRVPYELWFYIKTQEGQLSQFQFDEMLAFFRDKGLRDRETLDKYEEIFKLY